MTWLFPLVVSLLIFAMVHVWVSSVDPWGDPIGTLLGVGAYTIAFLLAIMLWLVWAVFS